MMCKINSHRLGLVFGILLAALHTIWSLLIALHLGQIAMDWIFRLHMLQSDLTVMPSSFSLSIILIIGSGIIGYLLGQIAGAIWNHILAKD